METTNITQDEAKSLAYSVHQDKVNIVWMLLGFDLIIDF